MSGLSLAISPLIFPSEFIESSMKYIFKKNQFFYLPLSGMDENVFSTAKKMGFEKHLDRILKLTGTKFVNTSNNAQKLAESALNTQNLISITVGENNVHEILDSLKIDH